MHNLKKVITSLFKESLCIRMRISSLIRARDCSVLEQMGSDGPVAAISRSIWIRAYRVIEAGAAAVGLYLPGRRCDVNSKTNSSRKVCFGQNFLRRTTKAQTRRAALVP